MTAGGRRAALGKARKPANSSDGATIEMQCTMPDNVMFDKHALRGARRARRAFTLVEMLVVIVVIAILGSIILFAMFSSQEAARAAKTRNMISKLHAAIMPKYESYITRRIPFRFSGTQSNTAYVRLHALRDLMRMEVPERWSDLEGVGAAGVSRSPVSNIAVPSVTKTYWRRIMNANVGGLLKLDTPEKRRDDGLQGAECLYLIISHGLEDADAIAQFSESDIGDTDNDGMREFLDGWGRPISFLRWAAGFGERHSTDIALVSPLLSPFSPLQTRHMEKDFDQFNTRRVKDLPATTPADRMPPVSVGNKPFEFLQNSPRAFAMYPLIYSGGPDQKFDLATGLTNPGTQEGINIHYHYPYPGANPVVPAYVDPYLYVTDNFVNPPRRFQIGEPSDNDADGDDNSRDNIHNHDMSNLR